MSTIFSKIIAGEIPANIVYEDDTVLAFLDIRPVHKGHTLVIPKIPSLDGLECDGATMAHIINVSQLIGRALKKSLPCDGINFIMNNGESAGQEVFHTHLHVIPRYLDKKVFRVPDHESYKSGEAESLAATIAEKLSN